MLPQEYYSGRKSEKLAELDSLNRAIKNLSSLRLSLGIALIPAVYFSFKNSGPLAWLVPLLIVALFLIVVRQHMGRKSGQSIVLTHLKVLEAELNAIKGDHASFDPGKEYIDTQHPYSFDLDIFGIRSVYQMLCRAVTIHGANGLASLLKGPYTSAAGIEERQHTIRELASKPDFLQNFRVAGLMFEEGKDDLVKIKSWLLMPDYFLRKRLIRTAILTIPFLTVLFLVLSVMQERFHPALGFIIVFNWILLGLHSKRIKETCSLVARNSKLIEKYEALHLAVLKDDFTTEKLSVIKERFSSSLKAIIGFRKLVHLFESRYNGMAGPLMNTLFIFDYQCLIRLERWRQANSERMLQSVDDVIWLDSQISCGIYTFNHPDHVFPHIDERSIVINGERCVHPLLVSEPAVGNDFTLGADEQFYLLTGANMTGKSTFIRTVGLSLVFSYLGLPVRAASLTIPLVKLYTAIRISDSVQDDISYFKAELNRIKSIMDDISASGETYLVLLDEPLRGTNTNDKQNGTRSIIRKLTAYNAIGIVATHDTVLCALEQEHGTSVRNYHFESTIEKNVLKFDYLLKPGCSTSNNATLLMEQLGIV